MASAVQTELRKEATIIGQPLRRMEDPRFITGTARYVDDIVLPGMLHGVFVRSPEAHAKILSISAYEALRNPSVKLVVTAKDLADSTEEMPTLGWGRESKATHTLALAADQVNFVGEAVALVVAEDQASAEDAAEAVQVEYDPLPVVVDPVKALEAGSPKVHGGFPDNLANRYVRNAGDVKRAFKEADFVVKAEYECPRLSAVPMEPRDILASYDPATDLLTAWVSSQAPHDFRDEVAEVLRLPDTHVRIIAPDMGGGFGQKGFYSEHAVVCFASMKLGRPIKWVESRRENLLAASHGRGQRQYVEAAVRKDGRILGLK
ncbi:MAG TPA: molybdopterin cofactor-binding domain-containing protein, partial [Nitrososphaerales archaeon]|nr:molybdopterin cofactor-binding domain-containing protein [Nitrososphaerales archaeon]